MEIERHQLKQATDLPAQQVNDIFDSLELSKGVQTEEFKDFFDHIPIAVIVSKQMRGDHRIVYANQAFELKTGRAPSEIIGRDWSILDGFRHENDPNLTIEDALLNGDDLLGIFGAAEPKALLCEVYCGRIQNEDGTENYRIALLVDVTVRDRVQREEFARQMREKDLLLKEIEHRVKNNLQLIAVLIRLEARSERLGEKVNLERLAGRIEAMQFLYKELSRKESGETVDLAHYLSQIASGVMCTHGLDGIQLDLSVESAPVSINIAMPVGLAVNELLTNAFKYAFVGRSRGVITLRCLRSGEDQYQLSVGDDGVGFPPGVQWPMEGKLGALIVQTLRENAKTDLRFESVPEAGTQVTIKFANTPPKGSDRGRVPPAPTAANS